jgi:hypothetical protein
MDDRDFVLRRQARDHVRANESGAADDDDPHSSYCNAGGFTPMPPGLRSTKSGSWRTRAGDWPFVP